MDTDIHGVDWDHRRSGRGLFGNSDVWVSETPSRIAAAMLGERLGRPPGELWRTGEAP